MFVAGPYTAGDVAQNVKRAIDAADRMMSMGLAVFVPHLSHFQHMIHARPYAHWTANDNEMLRRCDALFRLPGLSVGADDEVRLALALGLPVFYTWTELLDWINYGSNGLVQTLSA